MIKKLCRKRKWIFMAIWFLLAIPYIYMYYVNLHDSKYIDAYNPVYNNITENDLMPGLTVRPPDLSNLYREYLMIPVFIDRDKHIQMNVYEEYTVTEDMQLSQAALALEDELEARWYFLEHWEDFNFKSIPNDKRLWNLSYMLLNLSFINQDVWKDIDAKVDVLLSDTSMKENDVFDVYKVYADALGYTNIDVDLWREECNSFDDKCAMWYIEIIVFEVYTVICVGFICVKKFNKIRKRRNEKSK